MSEKDDRGVRYDERENNGKVLWSLYWVVEKKGNWIRRRSSLRDGCHLHLFGSRWKVMLAVEAS